MIKVGETVWCDKCTEEVVTVPDSEYGIPICPTCYEDYYLEKL